MLYLFDDKGVLKHTENVIAPNNESIHFNFIKDGSFFLKMTPFNASSSDFIVYYKRLGPFSYSHPILIDIRKLDSLNRYTAEYYIHDIIPDNLTGRSSTSAWILASKFPDAQALLRGSNPQPVMIELNATWVGGEYLLPKDAEYRRSATSSSHITTFDPRNRKTYTYNQFLDFRGTQQTNSLVPGVVVMGNFLVNTTNGYYFSEDLIKLKDKILGLPNDAKILHGKDSLLHYYEDGNYTTVNAITGAEVFRFNTGSEKMPISVDTVHIEDYYHTKKGVSYLITSRGIVVAN